MEGEAAFYYVSKLNLASEAVWEVPNSQVLVHVLIYPAYDVGMTATESTAKLGDTEA